MGARLESQKEEGENHLYIFFENFKLLKILKFRGNKIDWDCKIVKIIQKSKKIDLQSNSVENS